LDGGSAHTYTGQQKTENADIHTSMLRAGKYIPKIGTHTFLPLLLKVKIKLALFYLIEHHAIKAYCGLKV
jgi:hypothetical protein